MSFLRLGIIRQRYGASLEVHHDSCTESSLDVLRPMARVRSRSDPYGSIDTLRVDAQDARCSALMLSHPEALVMHVMVRKSYSDAQHL
jgi:hypothetical protein